MKVKPNFNVDKWCIYNESTFELEVKEDAPQEIKEKFKKWKEAYEYDESLEEEIKDAKN